MNLLWTTLGSGPGIPVADKNSSSYVLSSDKKLFLFDCGGGATASFLRSGFDPVDVQAIFISHTHADHICELPLFIQKLYHTSRTARLPIYLPDEAVLPIRNYLDSCYLFTEKSPFELELIPIKDKINFDQKLMVQSIHNSHLIGSAELIQQSGYDNKMLCYSFLVEVDNKRLLYSADLGSLEDIEGYMKNLDLLVIETMHIDISRLADLVDKYSVKQALLTHTGEEQRAEVAGFVESYSGECRIIIAEDNKTLEF